MYCTFVLCIYYIKCTIVQEEMKDNYLKKVVTPLTRCTNFLAGKKWLAGNTLTHVDFMFYEFLDQLRVFEASLFDGFPALKEYMTQFEVRKCMRDR
jgi:glutathione S-transferase